MTDAPERIWLQDDGDYSKARMDFHDLTWCEDRANDADTEYRRADLPPSWLANCFKCGRVVDTREQEAGGDGHGCQLTDGRWLCSSECWHKHLLKGGEG